MRDPDPTLTIKLKTRSRDEIPVAEETVVYHWDRIVLAAAASVLTAVAIASGSWYWLQAAADEPMQADSPSVASAPVSQSPPVAEPAEKPEVHARTEPGVDPAAPPFQKLEHLAVPEGPAAQSSPRETERAEPETPVESEKDVVMEKSERTLVQAEEKPLPERSSSVENSLEETVPAPPAEVRILSEQVREAQLTSGLRDKEPVDHAPAQVPMNDEGLIRVYFFTRLAGLKDRQVYHDWYLDGERVARVTVRPYTDLMRASSSKFIDRHMLGKWHVVVRTDQGKALARSEFEVL